MKVNPVRIALVLLGLAVVVAGQATVTGAKSYGDDDCRQVVEAIEVKLAQLQTCDPIPTLPGGFSECDILYVDLQLLQAEARVVCHMEVAP